MKKITLLILISLIIQGCNLFSNDEKLLAEHIQANGNKIKIYYVSLGATTNDVLQVRKDGKDTPIWVSDKYNFVASSKLIDDTLLVLVLSDTGYLNKNNKFDTVLVNVK